MEPEVLVRINPCRPEIANRIKTETIAAGCAECNEAHHFATDVLRCTRHILRIVRC